LKKRTKKLLLIWTVLVKTPVAQINKSFCALFSKSAAYFLLSFKRFRPAAAALAFEHPARILWRQFADLVQFGDFVRA
jgi:hypothetical protein